MGCVRSAVPVFFPLDEELGLLPGSLTPRLLEKVTLLSVWVPSFEKARQLLEQLTGAAVSEASMRRVTYGAGREASAEEEAEVARLERETPEAPRGAEQMALAVDGAFVPLVKRDGEWAEVRTLVIGQVAEGRCHSLSSFSRLCSAESFTHLALGEVQRRGVERAVRTGLLGDGAEWVQQFGDWHCPVAIRILDCPHAAERVHALTALGAAGDAERGRRFGSELVKQLQEQGPDGVLQVLRKVVAELGEAAHACAESAEPTAAGHLAYLEKRVEQMQYPLFAAAGWPIGSGMVESAHKQVMQERMKGPGMRWARKNVNPLLALRNAVVNERWDETWRRVRERRRRAVEERRRGRGQQKRARQETAVPPAPLLEGDTLLVAVAPPLAAVRAASERRGPHPPAANHPWRRFSIGAPQRRARL